jgi:hypothetical protein
MARPSTSKALVFWLMMLPGVAPLIVLMVRFG